MPTAPSTTRLGTLLGLLYAHAAIGSAAVSVIVPRVGEALGLDTGGRAWVLTCFALGFAVSTPVFGRLADLGGHRGPVIAGVALMATGAVVSALAPSFPVLVAGRLLQGAGAGSVPVLVAGIASAHFDDDERVRTLGRMAVVIGVAVALGPLIGGGIDALAGWRWVFALPALGLLLLPFVARVAPSEGTGGRPDLVGAALTMTTSAGFLLVLQMPTAGPAVGGLGALALLGGGLPLLAHARRTPEGFLPHAVVTHAVVLRASLVGLALPAANFALLFAVPTLLAERQGWSPLRIGVALVPVALVAWLTARRVGTLLPRVGAARVAGGGMLLAAAGVLMVAVLPGVPVAGIAGLAAVTAGFGLAQPSLTDVVSEAVGDDLRGVALGVFNLLFLLGGGIGTALLGGLSEVIGLPPAVAIVGVLPLVAAVVALRLPGRPRDRVR